MGPIVVAKCGGSLLAWPELPGRLRGYLDGLASRRVVLIVGGGPAADFVRDLDSAHGIGEKQSHGLALRALDLTANAVAAIVPGLTVVERLDELPGVWASGGTPVLAPRRFMEVDVACRPDHPEECWELTTDSIAALAARALGRVELHLLKSVGLGGAADRREASRRGIVDGAFPKESAGLQMIAVVNLRADPPTTEWLDAD